MGVVVVVVVVVIVVIGREIMSVVVRMKVAEFRGNFSFSSSSMLFSRPFPITLSVTFQTSKEGWGV